MDKADKTKAGAAFSPKGTTEDDARFRADVLERIHQVAVNWKAGKADSHYALSEIVSLAAIGMAGASTARMMIAGGGQ